MNNMGWVRNLTQKFVPRIAILACGAVMVCPAEANENLSLRKVPASVRPAPENANFTAAQNARDLQQSINSFTRPPVNRCSSSVGPVEASTHPAVVGARRVMGTLYQDCAITQKEVGPTDTIRDAIGKDSQQPSSQGNLSRVLNTASQRNYLGANPFLKDLWYRTTPEQKGTPYPASPACMNILGQPPIYAFGAKPQLNKSQPAQIDPFVDLSKNGCPGNGISCNSLPVSGLDCSGFISAALSSAGLRIDSNSAKQTHDPMSFSTGWLADAPRSPTSCLQDGKLNPDSLTPGDIINLSGSHVIMIDRVGADPFGIEGVQSCSDLGVEHFNFTYIHSGAVGSMGVSRIHAAYHARTQHRTTLMTNLLLAARQFCERKKGGSSNSFTASGGPQFRVIRHVGSAKPGCVLPEAQRRRIRGEECLNGCKL